MVTLEDAKLPFGIDPRTALAGTALFAAGFLIRGFFVRSRIAGVIESPRATLLPQLSKSEIANLPYPPDALPGARDIESPFGVIRAYEFGPADGRKVLLIHGISTPCLALGGLANALVEKGCRVLLFDLPGRGYSDTPSDLHHDTRLFTSLIFLVLTSSPLSWTGEDSGKFSLVGYSLGGGIGAAFASYFPDLIRSLVLIAPSGLIRDHHISRTSRILYSEGVIPEPILNRLVKKRLQKPLYSPTKPAHQPQRATAEQAVQAEVNIEGNQSVVLSKKHPNITIESAVNHQVLNHHGFVYSFMSSIRFGPIQNQQGRWAVIGKHLDHQPTDSGGVGDKVLILLGRKDPIIHVDEVQEDATEALQGHAVFQIFETGHELPVKQGEVVADAIWKFWNRTGSP